MGRKVCFYLKHHPGLIVPLILFFVAGSPCVRAQIFSVLHAFAGVVS
jgi:hypothetical protein